MLENNDFNTFINEYIGEKSTTRFFTYENIVDLFTAITSQFPYISRVSSIGKSVEGRDMPLLTLGSKIAENEAKSGKDNPPSIFLTSVHHAREVLGVTMNVYTMLYLIHSHAHNNTAVEALMTHHNFYSLPMVNVDGYALISDIYDKSGIFEMVRKNRRKESDCIGTSIGVDLNRNYGYKWGYDDIGSTSRQCEEDYRGVSPFSEPETLAVKNFMTSKNKNIKIAINFHTWGNLFIIPFNYDDQWNKEMVNKEIYKMYEDIRDSGTLPQGMLFGNGKQTIQYTANGDATDWMATQNGILAISPELGINNGLTDKFFPNQEWTKPIMEQNFKWINYTMLKLSSQLETNIAKFTRIECLNDCTPVDENFKRFYLEIEVRNVGFSEVKNVQVQFKETKPFEIAIIDGESKQDVVGKENVLKHHSLKSLESKTWKAEARISKEDWAKINAESTLKSETYLELLTSPYPELDSSTLSSRKLSKLSVMSSEVGPDTADKSSSYLILILLAIGKCFHVISQFL